ncbi:hypothetical protein X564_13775 [Pseudoalteromonas agarivorans]|nr:hypothetical protein X564_13775 [Pseudoalteromonas agarivorans]
MIKKHRLKLISNNFLVQPYILYGYFWLLCLQSLFRDAELKENLFLLHRLKASFTGYSSYLAFPVPL